jgi:hypothetical protein
MNIPKFVTDLYFLACHPSYQSVNTAKKKIINEILLLIGSPLRKNIRKTGDRIILIIERIFGIVIFRFLIND